MAITVNFDIPMPNEPYVNDFSNGNTQSATFKGARYWKVEKSDSDGTIGAVIADGDTEAELDNGVPAREGTSFHVIDAQQNPLQAAYITGMYETGDVADYQEDIGTTDSEGNAETWTYYWNDETGCISQIYLHGTLKFDGTNYTGPDFRSHAIPDDSFNDTYANQKAIIQAEIDGGSHPAEKVTELEAYITWLDNAPTKYAGIKHWKIPFPAFPEI